MYTWQGIKRTRIRPVKAESFAEAYCQLIIDYCLMAVDVSSCHDLYHAFTDN